MRVTQPPRDHKLFLVASRGMETRLKVLLDGLRFPEGPAALPDGSVVCVEVGGGTIVGLDASGQRRGFAETGGGPNGFALGPDGAGYVCNNGGFNWDPRGDWLLPHGTPADYHSGSVQKVDLAASKTSPKQTSMARITSIRARSAGHRRSSTAGT